MGTRNLTCVQLDGKMRVAQYCQWDGYPSGQGLTVLKFLRSMDRALFEQKVRSTAFGECPPYRNTGAKILQLIQDSEPGFLLCDGINFAADSLFCEWAYVVDLDANVLEVYKGFNYDPLPEGARFFSFTEAAIEMSKDSSVTYYPIRMLKAWMLNDLPSEDSFLDQLQPQEKENA